MSDEHFVLLDGGWLEVRWEVIGTSIEGLDAQC